MSIFDNATIRLFGRAVVAGAIAAGAALLAGQGGVEKPALYAAAGAFAHAFIEVFTPLNSLVGAFKKTPEGHIDVNTQALQDALDALKREVNRANA